MTDHADIAIIGAGAAGLAAAIFSAEQPGTHSQILKNLRISRTPRVVLLDGAAKIGAKILVSGGGRCNVTHYKVTPDDFNGPRNVVKNVLREFDERATVAWLESMGVKLKREETGKLFPVSDDAHTVLDALLHRCEQLGVELRTDHRVTDIIAIKPRDSCPWVFNVTHSQGDLQAARVILATGGRSLPKTGSDGGGWQIVRGLGHTVTPTYPALVPLVLDDTFFHAKLSGVSHEAELSTYAEGKLIDRRAGSLLWTHFGISGPVAMDASRFWVIAQAEERHPELRVAFGPGQTFEVIERRFIDAARDTPKRSLVSLLSEKLPRRVAEVLGEHLGIDGEIGQLPRESRRVLVHALTGLPLPVLRDRGWNYAEVTAGGVPLSEVDPRTMESRVVPGLYLIGEMLDCDGRIGGFNFQWAWSTGHIAGRAAGELSRLPD